MVELSPTYVKDWVGMREQDDKRGSECGWLDGWVLDREVLDNVGKEKAPKTRGEVSTVMKVNLMSE